MNPGINSRAASLTDPARYHHIRPGTDSQAAPMTDPLNTTTRLAESTFGPHTYRSRYQHITPGTDSGSARMHVPVYVTSMNTKEVPV
jgi:hypothetical protein